MLRLALTILASTFFAGFSARAETSPYFELRLYHVQAGKTDATIERFKEHIAALYARHALPALGYWTATNESRQEFFAYLLKAADKATFDGRFKAFLADPDFSAAYGEAMKKHGNTVDKIESIPLQQFSWTPPFPSSPSGSPRIFELRLYDVAAGRMEDYAASYRDHRLELFRAHGLENIGFWSSTGTNRPNTFVMMVSHESAAKINQAKASYHADPKWDQAIKPLEAEGRTTTGVISLMLKPTTFSPVQ